MVGSAVGIEKDSLKRTAKKTESHDGYFPPADISKLIDLLKNLI